MNILSDIFNVIIPIGAAIRNPNPANVILLVFLVAVLGFVGFQLIKFHFYEYKKIKNDLDDGLSLIKDLTDDMVILNYEKINQELSSNAVLGKLWYEYDKTVLKTKNEDEESVYSTVDAGFFFNNSNIIDARMNVQFYNAVPGILTGLGILGTFVGLTIGLSQIDLASDDVQVLKEGIKGLLAGVSTAFATSAHKLQRQLVPVRAMK